MKKLSILAMVIIVLFTLGARNLQAQANEMDLYVNLGLLTDDSFEFNPFIWSGGVNLDINFGNMLMFSPECNVIFWKFKFDTLWLAPGAILNVRYGLIFAGAGISKWLKLAGSVGSSDLLFKINAGFKGQKYRLAAYIETPFNDLFAGGFVTFGATLGFKF